MSATVTNCLDDTSVANHLVPASDIQLTIVCDDAGTCVNTVDATLDTPDGVRACIVVSGQGHTIQGDSAVAVRRSELTRSINTCAPIKDVKELPHDLSWARFIDDTVYDAWGAETGTSSTFSVCMSTSASTVICTGATDIAGNVGEVQFCGGRCVMVYLGSQEDTSCGDGQERRFYQSVCKDGNTADYSIYQLAFMDFEVRYVAVINGTAWNLWEEQPAGTVLSLSADLENPFTNYQMALQGIDYAGAHVSPEPMDRTDCYGYCGLANRTEDDVRMTMHGNCVTPSYGCTSGSSSCTATVQFFDQSRAGSALPVSVSGATLSYNGTNYIVQFTASAIPLKGRVEFSVPNAERVLSSEAATNVNGITTTLLPQDADHEDVVVVYTDGAVATASRDCAFTLLETRDKNRMYSMRNVRNVTECDLLLSNGASERSLSVAAQTTKNSGAVAVANATALWPAHPPGSESRSSGLSKGAKIGIGVGVPVGVIVIACTIVLFVYRHCRKKKEVIPLSSEEVCEPVVAEPPKEGNPLAGPAPAVEDNVSPMAAAREEAAREPAERDVSEVVVADESANTALQAEVNGASASATAPATAARSGDQQQAASKMYPAEGNTTFPSEQGSRDLVNGRKPPEAVRSLSVSNVQGNSQEPAQRLLSSNARGQAASQKVSGVPKPPQATVGGSTTELGRSGNAPCAPAQASPADDADCYDDFYRELGVPVGKEAARPASPPPAQAVHSPSDQPPQDEMSPMRRAALLAEMERMAKRVTRTQRECEARDYPDTTPRIPLYFPPVFRLDDHLTEGTDMSVLPNDRVERMRIAVRNCNDSGLQYEGVYVPVQGSVSVLIDFYRAYYLRMVGDASMWRKRILPLAKQKVRQASKKKPPYGRKNNYYDITCDDEIVSDTSRTFADVTGGKENCVFACVRKQAPSPQAPNPQAPNPQAPSPQAPNPQAPSPQAPNPQAPNPQAPNPQAPSPQAPNPQ